MKHGNAFKSFSQAFLPFKTLAPFSFRTSHEEIFWLRITHSQTIDSFSRISDENFDEYKTLKNKTEYFF